MNPLLKFLVKRLEGKIGGIQDFGDQVENHEAFQLIMEDVEVYFQELKQIVGDVGDAIL